jgi:arabinofuranosyltransferase
MLIILLRQHAIFRMVHLRAVNVMLSILRTRQLIVPLLVIFIALLIQTSWVGDDAFITMRTADNLVHGYGLRWNVDERVQSFTNPLWLFLVSGVYAIWGNSHLTLMFLSIVVSALALFLLLVKVPQNNFGLVLAFGIFILSKAFVDYSSSGLENPLTHLMLVSFAILYFQAEKPISYRQLFLLGLIAGLAAFNRIDTFLFYLPVLLAILWMQHDRKTLCCMLAGFTPFLLWELFSIIYFGFPFPNTYYARLHMGIPAPTLIHQGFLYFFNSLGWDPITLTITLSALALTFISGNSKEKLLAVGVCLYLIYVVSNGGDFMSGRFFTASLFVSVILLVRRVEEGLLLEKWIWISIVLLLGLIMAPIKSFSDPLEGDLTTFDPGAGIADERVGYYRYTNLLLLHKDLTLPPRPGFDLAKGLSGNDRVVIPETGIGMVGYFGGPRVHIIDIFGLADPLLARLPITNIDDWRIGHFWRNDPAGYIETIKSGKNQLANPDLAKYYDQLHLIVSGDVWSLKRMEAIWKMNTGQYDYLLDLYTQSSR